MKDKAFDCVRMKHEIQKQLQDEFKGLSKEERRRRTESLILSDPILARIWKNAPRTGKSRKSRS